MTVVFCDNSALSALAEMGMLDVLPQVLGPVCIPAAVVAEGIHPSAPDELRKWLAQPPDWVTIESDPEEILEETAALGAGEAAAITLAWRHRETSRLVLDERRGRAVARALGLSVIGLLAILVEAALLGVVDFEEALTKLQATGFRLSKILIEEARTQVATRSES